jgi:hypothetical protein
MSKLPWLYIVAGILTVSFLVWLLYEPAMTNDEVIAETRKCESAGLRAVLIQNGFNFKTMRVQCEPRKEKE